MEEIPKELGNPLVLILQLRYKVLMMFLTVYFWVFGVLRIVGFEDEILGNLWCLNLFMTIILLYYY